MTKVSFAGTITSLSSGYEIPGINVGDAVAGVLVYDPATPDTQPLSWMGYYAGAIKSLSVTIGGKSYFLAGSPQSPASEIDVINDDLVFGIYHDNLLFRAAVFEPANPSVVRFFQLTFGETASTPPTILPSDALPAKPMLDAFSFRRGFITYMPPGASQGSNMTLSSVSVITDWRSDVIGVFRPADGNWYIRDLQTGTVRQWGAPTDVPVAGDFDGDGQTDLAVWRPAEGNWYIRRSSDAGVVVTQWGAGALNDIPVPGDYDGDRKTDLAVWRPAEGNWYIRNSQAGTVTVQQWGTTGDVPVAADYDGDGKTDVAVWRPSDGNWYIRNSQAGTVTVTQWGTAGDVPVAGDFDGDGKTDIAVWRPAEGNWYIRNSSTLPAPVTVQQWGAPTDKPVPGDYDGDGKTDIAVWRSSEGNWYIINSATGAVTVQQWGTTGDVPVVGKW